MTSPSPAADAAPSPARGEGYNPQAELGPVMVPPGVLAAQCRKAIWELEMAIDRLDRPSRSIRVRDIPGGIAAMNRARAILGCDHG